MALPLIGAAVAVIGGIGKIISGNKAKKMAQEEERRAALEEQKARQEMERMKNIYRNLDTSNPYLNMENKFEDLTVNQQQARFQQQMFQQSQANILDSMRGAAGGSGIAALAQTLAQQGQIASQQASVSIGQQEQANQMAERREASRLDTLERSGVAESRQQEREKVMTLLGMSQQETAAYRQQRMEMADKKQEAQAGLWDSVGNIGSSILGAVTGGM
jgi:hypothetical protein